MKSTRPRWGVATLPKMPRSMPQKPQNRKQVLLRMWGYLFRYKGMLLLAFLLTVSSNLLALVGPKLSGEAIDAIGEKAGGVQFERVFYYCALMLGFYLASAVLGYILSVLMIRLSQRVVRQMREDVFHRLVTLPVGFFDRHQTGEIISHISYDIDTVNASLSSDLLQIATSVITVFGSFIAMLFISFPLLSVFVITIPVSIFVTRYMAKKVRPLYRKRSGKLGELNGYIEEMISGHKTIKAYHREETVLTRFDERNDGAVEAYYMADYYGSAVGPSVNFVNNLSLTLIGVLGAILFLLGRISIGDLSSFVLYSRKFAGPINEMANILSELQSAMAAAERVFRLIDEPCEPEDAPGAPDLDFRQGHVQMEHVAFAYEPDKPVIRDLSLDAKSGSLVAIVGHTGAGKTTLVNLLMRFYDPQGGAITIDGQDISGVTRRSLRKAFAMVLQDTWLFHGSVYDNLAYGKVGATQQEVEGAAKAAHIHSYIQSLPHGYQTILSEEGVNISQGQKQLLTIARAMLLDAEMLILDEATSNVDTRTEQQIQDAMQRLMQHKTCFVIAHRLSTVQNADTILVVRDGEIVEQGSHAFLMEQQGVYAQLYQSQFQ